jgi:16S rRNA G966 N2-methylase RsmD
MSKQTIQWESKLVDVAAIAPTPTNYKIKTKLGQERLRESLKAFGLAGNVVCNYAGRFGDTKKLVLIDGNSRREEAVAGGIKKLWVSLPSRALTPKEFKEFSAMIDFAKAGEVDMERIEKDLGTTEAFYDRYKMSVPGKLLEALGKKAPKFIDETKSKPGALRERFMEPPFSVLDTKTASWQQRKAAWMEIGIKSEIGRGGDLLGFSETIVGAAGRAKARKKAKPYNIDIGAAARLTGKGKHKTFGIAIDSQSDDPAVNERFNTSVFDPALTELLYHWFAPKHSRVLDPFAGGSVRGVIAHYLGHNYTGIELSREQVEANRQQGRDILKKENQPTWIIGDSDEMLDKLKGQKFDFILSCPPYADLEVYSNHSADLSTMRYPDFLKKYSAIIAKATALLKPKSYVAWVIGEVRDKRGYYYDFSSDTKRAFAAAGAVFYNDAVLIQSVGSASMRASKQFVASKKLVKIHQNVLIFYKP